MWSKLIYRIEVDCFKKHVEDIDYYSKDVYEARQRFVLLVKRQSSLLETIFIVWILL